MNIHEVMARIIIESHIRINHIDNINKFQFIKEYVQINSFKKLNKFLTSRKIFVYYLI